MPFIELIALQKPGVIKELTVFYGGSKPKVAVNPPWDGNYLEDSNKST
jgi:hypothetical protein